MIKKKVKANKVVVALDSFLFVVWVSLCFIAAAETLKPNSPAWARGANSLVTVASAYCMYRSRKRLLEEMTQAETFYEFEDLKSITDPTYVKCEEHLTTDINWFNEKDCPGYSYLALGQFKDGRFVILKRQYVACDGRVLKACAFVYSDMELNFNDQEQHMEQGGFLRTLRISPCSREEIKQAEGMIFSNYTQEELSAAKVGRFNY